MPKLIKIIIVTNEGNLYKKLADFNLYSQDYLYYKLTYAQSFLFLLL